MARIREPAWGSVAARGRASAARTRLALVFLQAGGAHGGVPLCMGCGDRGAEEGGAPTSYLPETCQVGPSRGQGGTTLPPNAPPAVLLLWRRAGGREGHPAGDERSPWPHLTCSAPGQDVCQDRMPVAAFRAPAPVSCFGFAKAASKVLTIPI